MPSPHVTARLRIDRTADASPEAPRELELHIVTIENVDEV